MEFWAKEFNVELLEMQLHVLVVLVKFVKHTIPVQMLPQYTIQKKNGPNAVEYCNERLSKSFHKRVLRERDRMIKAV